MPHPPYRDVGDAGHDDGGGAGVGGGDIGEVVAPRVGHEHRPAPQLADGTGRRVSAGVLRMWEGREGALAPGCLRLMVSLPGAPPVQAEALRRCIPHVCQSLPGTLHRLASRSKTPSGNPCHQLDHQLSKAITVLTPWHPSPLLGRRGLDTG